MNIPIKLKDDYKLFQSFAQKPWTQGTLIGSSMAGDDRPYAIILTEFGEFDFVDWFGIVDGRTTPERSE
jgi:hypothetical protein